jgi:hypothetical protein
VPSAVPRACRLDGQPQGAHRGPQRPPQGPSARSPGCPRQPGVDPTASGRQAVRESARSRGPEPAADCAGRDTGCLGSADRGGPAYCLCAGLPASIRHSVVPTLLAPSQLGQSCQPWCLHRRPLDDPVDHPDDPTGPFAIRPDRRATRREQARSVWTDQIDAEHQATDLAVGRYPVSLGRRRRFRLPSVARSRRTGWA